MERNAQKEIELIENEIQQQKKKSAADSEHYKAMKEAEANASKFTPEYLKLRFIEALTQNTKVYFGNSIPQFFSENAQLLKEFN